VYPPSPKKGEWGKKTVRGPPSPPSEKRGGKKEKGLKWRKKEKDDSPLSERRGKLDRKEHFSLLPEGKGGETKWRGGKEKKKMASHPLKKKGGKGGRSLSGTLSAGGKKKGSRGRKGTDGKLITFTLRHEKRGMGGYGQNVPILKEKERGGKLSQKEGGKRTFLYIRQ